jgi:hypothetical protein
VVDDGTWPETLALDDLHASEIINWMQGDEPPDGWPDERGHYMRRDHVEELLRQEREKALREAAMVAKEFAKAESGPLLKRRFAGKGLAVAGSARRRLVVRISSRILAELKGQGDEN